jgi:hypothetical protein
MRSVGSCSGVCAVCGYTPVRVRRFGKAPAEAEIFLLRIAESLEQFTNDRTEIA